MRSTRSPIPVRMAEIIANPRRFPKCLDYRSANAHRVPCSGSNPSPPPGAAPATLQYLSRYADSRPARDFARPRNAKEAHELQHHHDPRTTDVDAGERGAAGGVDAGAHDIAGDRHL